jgi:hypothetical protein
MKTGFTLSTFSNNFTNRQNWNITHVTHLAWKSN